MTKPEVIELGLITVLVFGVYLFFSWLPQQVLLGRGVIWIAGLVFLQSLVRDLSILFYASKKTEGPSPKTLEKQCFCLESLVGLSVLLVGFLLLFKSNSTRVALSQTMWAIAILAVLVAGFLIRDLVVSWRPIRIRKEKNHLNIIVKW